jgi:DNA-binding response OmpR family regulator
MTNDIRFLLSRLLDREGYCVLESRDGNEALNLIPAEPVDLVVLDLLMPGLDGFEFIRQLRSEPAIGRTPVIFYSAVYFTEDVASLARTCGVSHVLAKPTEPTTFLDTVRTVIGKTGVSPAFSTDEFNREHLRVVSGKLFETFRKVLARMSDLIGLDHHPSTAEASEEPRTPGAPVGSG